MDIRYDVDQYYQKNHYLGAIVDKELKTSADSCSDIYSEKCQKRTYEIVYPMHTEDLILKEIPCRHIQTPNSSKNMRTVFHPSESKE